MTTTSPFASVATRMPPSTDVTEVSRWALALAITATLSCGAEPARLTLSSGDEETINGCSVTLLETEKNEQGEDVANLGIDCSHTPGTNVSPRWVGVPGLTEVWLGLGLNDCVVLASVAYCTDEITRDTVTLTKRYEVQGDGAVLRAR